MKQGFAHPSVRQGGLSSPGEIGQTSSPRRGAGTRDSCYLPVGLTEDARQVGAA